jgi:acrylyl-CoA reductase (NADPH)
MPFRAFVVTRRDTGSSAEVTSLDDQELAPGELRVRVAWSGVNYKDAMATQPGNRVARVSPLVPGIDLAGEVVESAEPGVAPGTAVLAHGYDLGVARDGGFAELARIPAEWAVPLPPGLDARRAMVVGTAGFTAVLSVRRLHQVGITPEAGPVLVTGATGGVGSMAVAALAAGGFTVVASTGKAAEHDYLHRLGAAEVVGREDLATDPSRVLGAERWAAAVDCVGGETLASVLRTVRYGGAVAASGLTGGTELPTTVYPFIIRHVALLGVDSVMTPMEERRAVWATITEDLDPALLDQMVAREVGLDGVAEAAADVLAARVRGRVLVQPSA